MRFGRTFKKEGITVFIINTGFERETLVIPLFRNDDETAKKQSRSKQRDSARLSVKRCPR